MYKICAGVGGYTHIVSYSVANASNMVSRLSYYKADDLTTVFKCIT